MYDNLTAAGGGYPLVTSFWVQKRNAALALDVTGYVATFPVG